MAETHLDQWEREEAEREEKVRKNTVALIRKAKGVIHRLKWIQGAEWSDDVKLQKEETEGDYQKVKGILKWVATAWRWRPGPNKTYNVSKQNFKKVGAVCSIGAVSYAAIELDLDPHGEEYNAVVNLLNEADGDDIVCFNDEEGRTKNEVKEVFSKAVDLAEKRYAAGTLEI